jgi:hypothetical protein
MSGMEYPAPKTMRYCASFVIKHPKSNYFAMMEGLYKNHDKTAFIS